MPGRLVMNEEGAAGSLDLKKDRSQAQEQPSQIQAPAVRESASAQTNGAYHHAPNGVLPNGEPLTEAHPPTTNGESSSMATTNPTAGAPPPLDQSWREGEQNKSLGLLMERVAQQCYFDLNKTLDEMAAVPTEPEISQQPNGVAPHAGPDTSDGSLTKKRLLMEFVKDQRDRFTKTLVLSDWSRNGEEKARLIDVKVWQDRQRLAYEQAENALAATKMNMIRAKVPNPNIEGAMEVLATGKASWVPDLGYLPPKKLSANQLLKTLRDMNVILAARLSLHDELPPYFQDYSIADGRATFAVKDEFEVDLSVADEDPASPFYFIDIRLSFKPVVEILDDRIRGFLETMVNKQLASQGLKGCYDFLHNFILTHKMNLLRSQAAELIRGKWFDCIKVEDLRRSLVVQYWVGLPGPKSWIEIGVSSGKQKDVKSRKPATPHISVRWFQRGVEIKDEELKFGWHELDMEKCLSQVIEKHTARILNDLQSRITALAPANAPSKASVMDDDERDRKVLSLSLPSLRQPLHVWVEPVTGQFAITPPSAASLNTERRLNNDPTADAARWLAGLPCALVQERTRKEAELLRWTTPQRLIRQDNLATIFGEKPQHFSIFTPSRAWGDKFALVVTFDLGGEKWWVAELRDKQSEHVEGMGKIIASARKVVVPENAQGEPLTICRSTLISIEKWAVADISLGTLSSQLRDEHVPFAAKKLFVSNDGGENERQTTYSIALFIRLSTLMKDLQSKGWKAWADDVGRLTHHGFVRNTKGGGEVRGVRHDLRLSVDRAQLKELHKHIGRSKARDLTMNSTGGLALRFVTPFGQPFVKELRQRLHSIEQLDSHADLLKRRHFPCTHLSLSRLAFTYCKSPELSAELIFPEDGESSTMIKLHPHDSNPHQRIRVFLENGFNRTGDLGFEALTFILSTTLPVMRTFEKFEAKNTAGRLMSVHPRSSTWYSVTYQAPLPQCSFQLLTKIRHEGEKKLVKWLVHDLRASVAGESIPEDLNKAVKELWQENGEHWEGIGNGIIAETLGIAEALEKMDAVVRRFESNSEQPQAASSAEQQSTEPPKSAPKVEPKAEPNSTKPKPTTAGPGKAVKQEPDVIMLD